MSHSSPPTRSSAPGTTHHIAPQPSRSPIGPPPLRGDDLRAERVLLVCDDLVPELLRAAAAIRQLEARGTTVEVRWLRADGASPSERADLLTGLGIDGDRCTRIPDDARADGPTLAAAIATAADGDPVLGPDALDGPLGDPSVRTELAWLVVDPADVGDDPSVRSLTSPDRRDHVDVLRARFGSGGANGLATSTTYLRPPAA